MKRYILWHFIPRYAGGPYQQEAFIQAESTSEAIKVGSEILNVSMDVIHILETGIQLSDDFISENPDGCGWTDPFYNQCLRKANHKGLHAFTVEQFNDEMRRIMNGKEHRRISRLAKRK